MSDSLLFDAARSGNVDTLAAALDADPGKLYVRDEPYAWTLLHHAAHTGQPAVVDLLLSRGFDPNTKENGDHTTALHWAAAAGRADIVRTLADAGCDVVGRGDDHLLEVIGWASCWDGCDDDAHREVQEELLRRGAAHHIFSAIATDHAAEVHRIVGADPAQLQRRMSEHENGQLPLHFAVRVNKPEIVALLIELGADPTGKDADGFTAPPYATAPDVDRPIHAALRRLGRVDLLTALVLDEQETADAIARNDADAVNSNGTLHILAKRNHIAGVMWLLAHGAEPDTRWAHWDSMVTASHLAILGGHPQMVRILRDAGARTDIKDSKHHRDAVGWAQFFERAEILDLLKA